VLESISLPIPWAILILSQPNKQKLHNIGQNPHVMLGLETDRYFVVEGNRA
jgi:hypothetical protein